MNLLKPRLLVYTDERVDAGERRQECLPEAVVLLE